MPVKGRRRKRSAAARVRPFWMPIALGGLLVFAALTIASTWPGFDPKSIAVSGNHRVSRGEILARAAIAPRVSIWLQSTGAMAKRIEAIPYIATARVGRVPPATIRIRVSERTPFAVVRSGGEAALVDRALRVLEPATGDFEPVFVLEPGLTFSPGEFVRSRGAIELRSAYETIEARHFAAVEIRYDRYGGLVVTIRGGLRLLLGGENDLGEKLTLAGAILSQIVSHQPRVAAIDLRAPTAPILVYR